MYETLPCFRMWSGSGVIMPMCNYGIQLSSTAPPHTAFSLYGATPIQTAARNSNTSE